ncbi:MAG: TIGR03086 family protein [Acidobacteria bacterium]|nr:MAG: TIGR03086 family protein [Acidobacteriota bacterium]
MMTPGSLEAQLFRRLDECESAWARALEAVADDLDRPSAAPGWSMWDVANHVAGGAHRYRLLVVGESGVEETRTQDHVGGDPVGSFWQHERALREVATSEVLGRMVPHRAGPRRVDQLLVMRGNDMALHAWDIASAAGHPWPVGEDLAGWLLENAGPVIDELREAGFFAEPLQPTGDSSRDRLLARAGRRGPTA